MKAELEADFESFVATSGDRFYRTAYAITRDPQHAEDAVQAALASTYSRWRRLHDKQPEAYVRRMMVNEILGWGRRRSAPVATLEDPPLRRTGPDLVPTDAVWTALRELPVAQRALIALRYYEGLSVDEVADTLSTRPEVVQAQTTAALFDLRRLITLARQRART